MTRFRRIVALAVTVTAIATVWVFYGSDLLSGRVTSYYALCGQRGPDGRCHALGRTMDPSVFDVSVARQRVEVLEDGGGRRQLRSCAVTSRTDWQCRSATDDTMEVGYSHGRPWVRIAGSEDTDIVFVPRWRYLWLKSGEPHPELSLNRYQFRR